jgi:class 3 adenylate cyclase
LAIGFGEAGSDIIKFNLKSHNDLNPMMKGEKKTAFVGFCDIRGFLLVNEALKEDTVIFVNRIAEIVHKSVDKFGGATNKNIGDAFLNIWKFPELNPNKETYKISPTNIYSQVVADKAVLSFLYIIRSIKLSQDILEYSDDKRIKKAFPHGYKVNMGFGIHYGWAIEGTIGSKYKIDASYLSPNVNIAARLEAATRQYGVTILISGQVYEFLSNELQDICREIDRVTVKGSLLPIRLFTIDVNLSNLDPDNDNLKRKKENLNVTVKIKKFLEKKILYKNYYDKCDSLVALNFRTGFFLKNLDILFEGLMNDTFYEKFSYGFDKYIEGRWFEASVFLNKCLQLNEDDGPTKVLLSYMGEYNFIAPSTWKGYRELTSK